VVGGKDRGGERRRGRDGKGGGRLRWPDHFSKAHYGCV